MFSRHSDRPEDRPGQMKAVPSTGMRDATPVPVAQQHEASPLGRGEESVVGREDRFEGTVRVQKGLRVLGTVTGKIEAATYVHVEESANVEADLTADEAIIAGHYSGKLVCRQRLEIRSTGLVKGEIETVRLMLHEGGFIDGELHMRRPDAAAGNGTGKPSEAESVRGGISPRTTIEVARPTTAGVSRES